MQAPESKQPFARFESTVEPRLLLILFMLLWSGMAWLMTAILGYGFYTEPTKYPELVAVWIAVFGAAVMSTSWIIWQVRGKEIIEITDEGMTLRHVNALFKNRLFLRIDEVESINAEVDKDTPWWIRQQWGIGGGSIAVGHHGSTRRWGIDLRPARAERIAQELRRALEERLAVVK